MLQYSSAAVDISWIGIDLTPGLSQGTFISFVTDTPTWTYIPDGLGGGIRLFNDNSSGSVSLVIDTEHKTHQVLLSFAFIDRISKNIIGPMFITDRNTKQKIILKGTFIIDEPDESRSSSSLPVTWLFKYQAKSTVPSLGDNAQVGK